MATRLRKTRRLRGGRHMGWGQVGQHRASGHQCGRQLRADPAPQRALERPLAGNRDRPLRYGAATASPGGQTRSRQGPPDASGSRPRCAVHRRTAAEALRRQDRVEELPTGMTETQQRGGYGLHTNVCKPESVAAASLCRRCRGLTLDRRTTTTANEGCEELARGAEWISTLRSDEEILNRMPAVFFAGATRYDNSDLSQR